jgi:hypothetical protein
MFQLSVEILPYLSGKEETNISSCSFYAGLPLIFRQSFNDDFLIIRGKKITGRNLNKKTISAIDIFGTATFLNKKEVLFARDVTDETVYLVKLFYN